VSGVSGVSVGPVPVDVEWLFVLMGFSDWRGVYFERLAGVLRPLSRPRVTHMNIQPSVMSPARRETAMAHSFLKDNIYLMAIKAIPLGFNAVYGWNGGNPSI